MRIYVRRRSGTPFADHRDDMVLQAATIPKKEGQRRRYRPSGKKTHAARSIHAQILLVFGKPVRRPLLT